MRRANRLILYAQPTACDVALLLELNDNQFCGIGRNIEADTNRAAGRRVDRSVYADHVAIDVERWASGIAFIDGRIDLNVVVIRTGADIRPRAETMPAVTVPPRPNGLPTAIIRTAIYPIKARGTGWSGGRCSQALKKRSCLRGPHRLHACLSGLCRGHFARLGDIVQCSSRAPQSADANLSRCSGKMDIGPSGTAHDAIKRVAEAIVQRKTRVLDFDLRAYFDNVRHDRLLEKVAQRINDADIMHLLKLMLKASGKKGAKITCNEFLAGQLTDSRSLAIWLNGYVNGARGKTLIDPLSVGENSLIDYCVNHTNTLVLDEMANSRPKPKQTAH
jgi:hypothetical protein